MDNKRTFQRKLLTYEDIRYKTKILQTHLQDLHECNQEFNNLFVDLIVSGDQSGRIMERAREKLDTVKNKNNYLLEELDRQIVHSVNNLHGQVDDMKTQSITVTYEPLYCID